MKGFKTTITWHIDEKPTKTGTYLCLFVYNHFVSVSSLSYSSKHKTFNVQDYYTKDEVNKTRIDDVFAWSELFKIENGKLVSKDLCDEQIIHLGNE